MSLYKLLRDFEWLCHLNGIYETLRTTTTGLKFFTTIFFSIALNILKTPYE